MEQGKGFFSKIIIILVTMLVFLFAKEKLKENGIQLPTLGEYLAFGLLFGVFGWIVYFIFKVIYHLFIMFTS